METVMVEASSKSYTEMSTEELHDVLKTSSPEGYASVIADLSDDAIALLLTHVIDTGTEAAGVALADAYLDRNPDKAIDLLANM